MKRVFKKLVLAIICAISLLAISLLGCSKSGDVTAPSNTIITLNPDNTSLSSLPTPALIPFKAVVTDEKGKPMNDVKLYITGTFAVPFGAPNWYYQFYKDKEGLYPVNSGFEGKTNDDGVYEFSVRVSGLPFDDQNGITVSSGTAIATASLKVE